MYQRLTVSHIVAFEEHGRRSDARALPNNTPPLQFCRVITDPVFLRGSEIAVFYHAASEERRGSRGSDVAAGTFLTRVRVYT